MQTVDVLYCIEHVARELDIACAIKCLARRRHGLNVHVTSIVECTNGRMRDYRPRLIAVPYFFSRRDPGVRDLLRRFPGVRVVNLALEQLLSEGNKKFRSPKDDTARHHVVHLAAGDFFRDFLCEHGVRHENVTIVGSPSGVLYRRPYRAYFEKKRETFAGRYGLDANKPWVFFPENFGAAFLGRSAIRYRIRRGADPADVYAYRDFARDSFREIMPWCRDAAALGTVEVIVRPRPATGRDAFVHAYKDVAGDVPECNLHFIKDHSIREWILASDLVVSSYSTSLIEAAIAKKPIALLAPVPFCESVRTNWCDVPPCVTTRSQFIELLANVDQQPVAGPLTMWAEQNLLPCGDPIANTTNVLASICHDTCSSPPAPPPVPQWRAAAESVLRTGRSADQWFSRHVKGKKNARSNLYENDQFTTEEVDRRTARWEDILSAPEDRQLLLAGNTRESYDARKTDDPHTV